MKPSSRIALIEMNRDDPKTPHRNSPDMLLSKDEVKSWMAAAGFYPAEEFDVFGSPSGSSFIRGIDGECPTIGKQRGLRQINKDSQVIEI